MLLESLGALEFYALVVAIVGSIVRWAKSRIPIPPWSWPIVATALSFLLVGGDALAGGAELAAAAWKGLAGLFAGPLTAGTHETAKALLDPIVGPKLRITLLGRAQSYAEIKAKKAKKKDASTAAIVLVAVGLAGCGPRVQRYQVVAATTMAEVSNEAAQEVAKRWETGGDAIVDSGKPVEEIEEDLKAHEARYREIWRALDLVAALHDTWATALEEDGDAVSLALLARLRRAYCAARVFVDELPQIAALPCPEGAQ